MDKDFLPVKFEIQKIRMLIKQAKKANDSESLSKIALSLCDLHETHKITMLQMLQESLPKREVLECLLKRNSKTDGDPNSSHCI